MPPKAPPPPFLDDEPPPWLARVLATSALVVASVALLAAIIIKVPETVSGAFMLVPARGADPVRAPHEGVVSRVATMEATPVRRGDTLFVLASEPALDRVADREGLEATVAQAAASRRDLLIQLEAVRNADAGERDRLEVRLGTLGRSIAAKREQLRIARELESRARAGVASHVTTEAELSNLQLNASRLEDDIAIAEGALADARAAQGRLRYDAALREADGRERVRKLDLEIRQAAVRLDALRATGTAAEGLVAVSPCNGTLVRLRVRAAGAFVDQGDALADVACTADSLVVEMEVPASGIGRVRAGQDVRLLYDAFPYQRYGVRYATVTWVGAANGTTAVGDSAGFRARAIPEDSTIRVDGADRPLVPGMGGIARVVVERRRLITYAFAPLIQLRDAVSDRPRTRTAH